MLISLAVYGFFWSRQINFGYLRITNSSTKFFSKVLFFDETESADLLRYVERNFSDLCFSIFDGKINDSAEILSKATHEFTFNYTSVLSSTSSFCDVYLRNEKSVPLVTEPKNDGDFPLAFGIMIYNNFEQVDQLFRIIYRPQNYYCFHIDDSSPKEFKAQVILTLMHSLKKRVRVCWFNFRPSEFAFLQLKT